MAKTDQILLEHHLRDELNLSSFQLMNLCVAFNETFNIDLGVMAMQGREFHTVGDLQALL